MNRDSSSTMNLTEPIKLLSRKCYGHLSAGREIYMSNRPLGYSKEPCKLCLIGIGIGYWALDCKEAGRMIEEIYPFHRLCLERDFNNAYDAAIIRAGWHHVSKARLLPLGDVCSIIATILGDLIKPADVYWVMFQ